MLVGRYAEGVALCGGASVGGAITIRSANAGEGDENGGGSGLLMFSTGESTGDGSGNFSLGTGAAADSGGAMSITVGRGNSGVGGLLSVTSGDSSAATAPAGPATSAFLES